MESLLEEDNMPSKSGASKRKLKKDRRLKRQELEQEQEMEDAAQTGGEVAWDEDQVGVQPLTRRCDHDRRLRGVAHRTFWS